MRLRHSWLTFVAFAKRWFGLATEPVVLFPLFALLLLGLIWGSTLNLIKVERTSAERAALVSSREIVETYEAQVMRTLSGIEQTLKFVKHSYELNSNLSVLYGLQREGLLPPDLIFEVAIADRQGNILVSTRNRSGENVADHDYFAAAQFTESIVIGKPRPDPDLGGAQLVFSLQLDENDEAFNGIVLIRVNAGYFVSSYDTGKLGQQGLLGLLGTDGVFRVRRQGGRIQAGIPGELDRVLPEAEQRAAHMVQSNLITHKDDGVTRYVSARPLDNYPLVVIAGLSRDEQLAATRHKRESYLQWAAAGSVMSLLLIGILGYMSWQLAHSRRRALQAQIDHAARIEHLAYHDALTGLPNRSLFAKLLQQAIHQGQRYQHQFAVLFLDLDRFKHINDTLGHGAGDVLLQEVSQRLRDCLRASDTVARQGGDEFVILLPEFQDSAFVVTVAEKILAAVAQPFLLQGREFEVTTSIGISLFPQDGMDEQSLTKHADLAMYRAKELGKNKYQFYSDQVHQETLEQLGLEADLRKALEHDEFRLYFQGRYTPDRERLTGAEVLLRWQHPRLGLLTPSHFLHLAEASGLILGIGRWVLQAACRQNADWQRQGLTPVPLSVNLTARQFFDVRLLADVADALAGSAMAPGLLELEIKEQLLIQNPQQALQIMASLQAMGVLVALDDFGASYAHLFSLKRFPLSLLKIDQSLLDHSTLGATSGGRQDVSLPHESRARTKPESTAGISWGESLVALAQASNATVVAQGVETREQARSLLRYRFDEVQGYYFDHPAPAQAFGVLIHLAQKKWAALPETAASHQESA